MPSGVLGNARPPPSLRAIDGKQAENLHFTANSDKAHQFEMNSQPASCMRTYIPASVAICLEYGSTRAASALSSRAKAEEIARAAGVAATSTAPERNSLSISSPRTPSSSMYHFSSSQPLLWGSRGYSTQKDDSLETALNQALRLG